MKRITYKLSIGEQPDSNSPPIAKTIVRYLFIPFKSLQFYVFYPIFDNKKTKMDKFLKYSFATINDLFPEVLKLSNPINELKLIQNESRF